jgi:hypothetical protein
MTQLRKADYATWGSQFWLRNFNFSSMNCAPTIAPAPRVNTKNKFSRRQLQLT